MTSRINDSGFSVIRKDVVGSTNDEARALAEAGSPDRTVVWAGVQTEGRGRRGRHWDSPAGNLYVSLLLRPARAASEAAQLSFVASLALGEAVGQYVAGERIRHKWPNDVLVDGRKIAGLLLESVGTEPKPVEWAIVGCGVNVASHPDVAAYPTTSLNIAAGRDVGIPALLETFLARFDVWYRCWLAEGIGGIRQPWLDRAEGLGREITVRLPNREMHGTFEDLDPSGALVLGLPGGKREIVTAGDVFAGHLRGSLNAAGR